MALWEALLGIVRAALFLFSHLWGGNLGWGIITLSALIRLALLPWTLRAARRAEAMRRKLAALAPQLELLKRRHANDPVQLHTAVAREYERAGIRPIRDAGLGVTAAQLPIGLALFTVIRNGVGAGSAFLWITNLARPDLLMALLASTLTGLLAATAPNVSSNPMALPLVLLTAGATFVFALHMASGVALYWASSAGVGLLQNALLRRRPAGP